MELFMLVPTIRTEINEPGTRLGIRETCEIVRHVGANRISLFLRKCSIQINFLQVQ